MRARGQSQSGRASDLAARSAALGAALEAATGRVEEVALTPIREIQQRAAERAALSAEHTVVALAGATGAGKSSVFNALVGAQVARTSAQRPTTSHPLAAIAERPALRAESTALLEWLGVGRRHDLAVSEQHPDGLVLLDLPDHDSVVAEHRLRADHVTERADVLIWVTNPQKYADGVLHRDYLAPTARQQGIVVVVLNQIDRLTPADATACLADLTRLVAADQVAAQVIAASALTGAGIPELQTLVRQAGAARQAANARLLAQVRSAAGDLLTVVADGNGPGGDTRAARSQLITVLEQAAGVPLVVQAVAASAVRDARAHTGWPPTRWLGRLRADPLRTLGLRGAASTRGVAATHPHDHDGEGSAGPSTAGSPVLTRTSLPPASPALRAQVASAARGYVAASAAELPPASGERLRAQVVARSGELADALDVAVAESVQLRPARWWRWAGAAQWLLLATAAVGLVWLAVLAVLTYLQLPTVRPPVLELGALVLPWPTGLLIAGVLLGWLLAFLGGLLARAGARRRARAVAAGLRRRVAAVADERLLNQVEGELTAWRTIREQARAAAR